MALYSGSGNSTLDGGSASGDYFGITAQGADTVSINTGVGSTVDHVDMSIGGFASSAAGGLPAAGSTDGSVTLTFSNNQNIVINSHAGTTIELTFTDKTVTYSG